MSEERADTAALVQHRHGRVVPVECSRRFDELFVLACRAARRPGRRRNESRSACSTAQPSRTRLGQRRRRSGDTAMRALVLGGAGEVGARIVAELRASGDVAFAVDRQAARVDRVVDIRADLGALRGALADVNVVINATGLEEPALAAVAARHGVAFVDITASTAYVAALERLDVSQPVLLSVGVAPGLTNLLAADLHANSRGPIDVVVLFGSGERYGAEGIAWVQRLLGKRFRDAGPGKDIRNFTRSRLFGLQRYGRRRVYRADFSDQHVLTRDLQVPVRTYFGLDSRVATAALAMMTWLPVALPAPRTLQLPGSDRWLTLAVSQDGTIRWAGGHSQSHATAVVAAAAAQAVGGLTPGVHHLHRVLTLNDLPIGRGIHIGGSGKRQDPGG